MDNALMTTDEMTQRLAERPNRRLNYKAESDAHKAESLAADIENRIVALKQTAGRQRVDFSNLSQVQERTYAYLEACGQAEAFPSVQGLAVLAYGYSRQGLNRFLREHPDAPAAQFVEMAKDIIVDILTNQSLYRNCDSVQAIFQMKNNHDFADRVQVEAVTAQNPLGGQVDQQALMERYQDLPED